MHSIDLHTIQKSELCFRHPYYFRTLRAGGIDGFTLFFQVFFDDLHIPMTFSAAPKNAKSEWLQTAFYFNKTIWVNENIVFYGGLQISSNGKDSQDPNLNELIVAFEMLTGDPQHNNVAVNMTWNMHTYGEALGEIASNDAKWQEAKINGTTFTKPSAS